MIHKYAHMCFGRIQPNRRHPAGTDLDTQTYYTPQKLRSREGGKSGSTSAHADLLYVMVSCTNIGHSIV